MQRSITEVSMTDLAFEDSLNFPHYVPRAKVTRMTMEEYQDSKKYNAAYESLNKSLWGSVEKPKATEIRPWTKKETKKFAKELSKVSTGSRQRLIVLPPENIAGEELQQSSSYEHYRQEYVMTGDEYYLELMLEKVEPYDEAPITLGRRWSA